MSKFIQKIHVSRNYTLFGVNSDNRDCIAAFRHKR